MQMMEFLHDVLPKVLSGGVLVGGIAWQWRTRQGVRINGEGLGLMARGQIAAALEKFEAAAPRLGNQGVGYYNAGAAKLALWRARDAVHDFEIARTKRLDAGFKGDLLAGLALASALIGDLQKAHGVLSGPEGRQIANDPIALLSRAVIACREGAFAQAGLVLERDELLHLGGLHRGLGDALRAWCREVQDRSPPQVDLGAVLGEASLDQVYETWPELAEFLERA